MKHIKDKQTYESGNLIPLKSSDPDTTIPIGNDVVFNCFFKGFKHFNQNI